MHTQAAQQNRVETPATAPGRSQVAAPAAPVREDVFAFIRRDSMDAPMDYVREINVPGGGE